MTTYNLFSYGTLCHPYVFEKVVGVPQTPVYAKLKNYQVYSLRDRIYQGIIQAPGFEAIGVLYRDVSALDLSKLDKFEGDEYLRREVFVQVEGMSYPAMVYVWKSELDAELGNQGWDFEHFITTDLTRYLKMELDDST